MINAEIKTLVNSFKLIRNPDGPGASAPDLSPVYHIFPCLIYLIKLSDHLMYWIKQSIYYWIHFLVPVLILHNLYIGTKNSFRFRWKLLFQVKLLHSQFINLDHLSHLITFRNAWNESDRVYRSLSTHLKHFHTPGIISNSLYMLIFVKNTLILPENSFKNTFWSKIT